MNNHGAMTGTFLATARYVKEKYEIISLRTIDNDEDVQDKLDDLESMFVSDLSRQYLAILRNEWDYRTSDEGIAEVLINNEYEFTKNGKLFNL